MPVEPKPDLLPCPFCGATGSFIGDYRPMQVAAGDARHVQCKACGTHGPTAHGRADAAHSWNLRALDAHPEVVALRDRLTKAESERDALATLLDQDYSVSSGPILFAPEGRRFCLTIKRREFFGETRAAACLAWARFVAGLAPELSR